MTPEEQHIANDFEKGWSEDRIRQAKRSWGPGLLEILPAEMTEKIQRKAALDGTSDIEVIQKALHLYLSDDNVA